MSQELQDKNEADLLLELFVLLASGGFPVTVDAQAESQRLETWHANL